ncbi:coatomer subunit gamma [Kluyveromyces marxianus DMKU3-1042]|uniref:Coatomer subunit gamma n=1 Tax=Kluyveromyces marxianus (strain DMKU3-1042 / BCC 29191 / NBRC 104275) TaxID=1003335 RepID=W0TGP9_KLUMD|nr:coatomer subunit gamma [Kluyveromyces marxianus DMKU3-1042]BAO42248.1 coatomer subunit gamma [Kluyveromyces marxianus DMKU3-1042]
MSTHTYKKSEDPHSGSLPDKMAIYQDCLNRFNESPVNPKLCRTLITSLLELLSHGETFPRQEATALFFSISKLFQHPNDSLRQIVYVAIKELCGISDDILMATSSIMKDVQNGSDLVKPNAIRALIRVLDESTAFSAERLLKNSLVSKNPSVCSASLVSSYHLLPIAEATVKRFANETQEAVGDLKQLPFSDENSRYYPTPSHISQYHALGLLYRLKNHDKMALIKLIQQFSGHSSPLKNALAQVQMVKIVHNLVLKDPHLIPQFLPLAANWLQNRHEAVALEACKLVTSLSNLVPNELYVGAISVLQGFLSTPRVATRFAAVRLLNRISMVSPEKIVVCNPELESLVNDSNRNISTYTITTLLKTGTDKNIGSLIKTITKFIHEVNDDFKVIIIEAIRTLSLKFPEECDTILHFLIESLQSAEGSLQFKNSIVEALIDLIQFVPQSKEKALEELCDFIEDCEFNEILVRVLHLLGKEGPTTKNPSLYVRHIYNRVILENSVIRSAAVVALSKFALVKNDPELVHSIEQLLVQIKTDPDDEVRDRASIALEFIESVKAKSDVAPIAQNFIRPSTTYDVASLENKLSQYLSQGQEAFQEAFDPSSVAKYSEDELKALNLKRRQEQSLHQDGEGGASAATAGTTGSGAGHGAKKSHGIDSSTGDHHAGDAATDFFADDEEQSQQLSHFVTEMLELEQFQSFGKCLHSSKIVPLTEIEAEFVVKGIKHLFNDHVVLQFHITNTLKDIALDNVEVACQPEGLSDGALGDTEEFVLPIERLLPDESESCYVCFAKSHDCSPTDIIVERFSNSLKFQSKELDPSTSLPFEDDEGFEDEYEIDPLFLSPGDYMKPSFVSDFTSTFEELPHESVAVYNIVESNTLQEVIDKLLISTGGLPLDNSRIVSHDTTQHTLKISGKSILDNSKALLSIKMIKTSKGIALKAQVKSDNETLAEDLANNLI